MSFSDRTHLIEQLESQLDLTLVADHSMLKLTVADNQPGQAIDDISTTGGIFLLMHDIEDIVNDARLLLAPNYKSATPFHPKCSVTYVSPGLTWVTQLFCASAWYKMPTTS